MQPKQGRASLAETAKDDQISENSMSHVRITPARDALNSYIDNEDIETLPSQVHRQSQQFIDEPPVVVSFKKQQ